MAIRQLSTNVRKYDQPFELWRYVKKADIVQGMDNLVLLEKITLFGNIQLKQVSFTSDQQNTSTGDITIKLLQPESFTITTLDKVLWNNNLYAVNSIDIDFYSQKEIVLTCSLEKENIYDQEGSVTGDATFRNGYKVSEVDYLSLIHKDQITQLITQVGTLSKNEEILFKWLDIEKLETQTDPNRLNFKVFVDYLLTNTKDRIHVLEEWRDSFMGDGEGSLTEINNKLEDLKTNVDSHTIDIQTNTASIQVNKNTINDHEARILTLELTGGGSTGGGDGTAPDLTPLILKVTENTKNIDINKTEILANSLAISQFDQSLDLKADKAYVDNLFGTSSETWETIKRIEEALKDQENFVGALNTALLTKADQVELDKTNAIVAQHTLDIAELKINGGGGGDTGTGGGSTGGSGATPEQIKQIELNKTNIATNKDNIATNTADIATNSVLVVKSQGDIITNTLAIEALQNKIGDTDFTTFATKKYVDDTIANTIGASPDILEALKQLKELLGDNEDILGALNEVMSTKADKEDLDNLTTKVNTNTTNITTNTTNIQTNTNSINTLNATLDTKADKVEVEKNKNAIATNTNDIGLLQTNVSRNTTDLTVIKKQIADGELGGGGSSEDLTAIELRVGIVEDKTNTNASLINTNKTNIETNATNIATNTSQIATNKETINTVNVALSGKVSHAQLDREITPIETQLTDHETRIKKIELVGGGSGGNGSGGVDSDKLIELIADVETNKGDIAQIKITLDTHNNKITVLETQVPINTQNIANLTSSLALKADKSYVDEQIGSSEDTLAMLEELRNQLNDNEDVVGAINLALLNKVDKSEFDALKLTVDTIRVDTDSIHTDIDTNKDNITTLQGEMLGKASSTEVNIINQQVLLNKAAITELKETSDTTALATQVATNTTDITTLKTTTETITSNLERTTAQVNDNADEIKMLLEDQVTPLKTQVATNTADIAVLKESGGSGGGGSTGGSGGGGYVKLWEGSAILTSSRSVNFEFNTQDYEWLKMCCYISNSPYRYTWNEISTDKKWNGGYTGTTTSYMQGQYIEAHYMAFGQGSTNMSTGRCFVRVTDTGLYGVKLMSELWQTSYTGTKLVDGGNSIIVKEVWGIPKAASSETPAVQSLSKDK